MPDDAELKYYTMTKKAIITGIEAYLPEYILTNDELALFK